MTASLFFNKLITVAVNCRDLLNSRQWETFTSGDNFTRHQINKRGGRRFNFTVTWNFGNMKQKHHQQTKRNDGSSQMQQMDYNGTGEE